jgi:hypothetical protein
VLATLPIRMYANVNLRQDYQRPEDKADLLLDPNQIDGLLTRLRFGMEFKDAKATVSGGLRVSVGETPNPAAPSFAWATASALSPSASTSSTWTCGP